MERGDRQLNSDPPKKRRGVVDANILIKLVRDEKDEALGAPAAQPLTVVPTVRGLHSCRRIRLYRNSLHLGDWRLDADDVENIRTRRWKHRLDRRFARIPRW
jgi:hypothetical protein